MENQDLSTRDKILREAIDLVAEKGFKSTTIKEIAEKAGISEMTVFRHFKTKTSIIDEAIKEFTFEIPIKKNIEDKISWDLEKDLQLISKAYHQYVNANEKVLMIKLKEGQNVFNTDILESPRKLRSFLVDYFSQMQKLGKMIVTDCDALALSFISLNFGYFCARIMPGSTFIDISVDDYIESSVKVFTRGLSL